MSDEMTEKAYASAAEGDGCSKVPTASKKTARTSHKSALPANRHPSAKERRIVVPVRPVSGR